ncbi:MAG: hypothetical protein SAK29_17455 [Scytonema sp. PMC 1069.18]|nr:hypothetical protein [Scytonema sp. PMC 1069.18]MEC4882952.1 hypothetical protein [Scytonema sp. PMC 1070.18]
MTHPDFDKMARQELLAYVRQHPQDAEAFHKYMDMLAVAPGRVEISLDQLETELTKRLQQS